MKIKIKGIMFRGTEKSTGYDLYSSENYYIPNGRTVVVKTGVSLELPEGHDAMVRPRSSMSKRGILCHNGTIDNDYRGEIGVCLTNLTGESVKIEQGERVAQLVFSLVVPVEFDQVDKVSTDTSRGVGGWGSTGR